jgi:beta-galactosidase
LLGCAAPAAAGPDRIEFGTDYYAEDWPAERTETDAKLMQSAGLSVVRLVDTNWERTEPAEGKHDFAWLDRVIGILNRYGMRVILGTSSYVPPAWLMERHPEFYAVNKDGVRYRWGGMGWVCLNNPLLRQFVQRHVTALAEHYGSHPGVIGWQIDNELGTWGYTCYDSDHCVPKFQNSLQSKFGTLEELNQRWLTVSYGHRYSSWKQIPLNWTLGSQAHQAPLELGAQRFFSSNVSDYMDFQAAILRRHAPKQFLTHNIAGPSVNGNAFEFARSLDFLSFDSYPRIGNYFFPGFAADLVRGANHGGSFLVLEHRSGYVGPFSLTDPITPSGLIRLWAWQTLAHGGDGVLFFRWRMSTGGSEQYWQGLLNYDGTTNRAYDEVARMGREVMKVGSQFARATSPATIGEILSYDSLWALHVGGSSFPYFDQLAVLNRAFRRQGLNVDVLEPTADLSKYKVVLAPTLHVVTPAIAATLDRFVHAGGVLVLSARSGFKTEDNLATERPLPGLLLSLTGARVTGFSPLQSTTPRAWLDFPSERGVYKSHGENEIVAESANWPGSYTARGWADILEPAGAKILFRYAKDFYSGSAAVTLSEVGAGKVLYIGPLLEPRFYHDMARRVCRWANLETGPEIPEGVDYAIRQLGDKEVRFLLNFGTAASVVQLPGSHRDLLTNESSSGSVSVPSLDLRVLVRP